MRTDYFAFAVRTVREQFPVIPEDADLVAIRQRDANDRVYVDAVRRWFRQTDAAATSEGER